MSAAEHESVLFGRPMAAAEGLTAGQRWTAAVALGLASVLLAVNGHRHIVLGSLTSGSPASTGVPPAAVGPVPLPETAPMPAMSTFPTAAPPTDPGTTGDSGGITFTPSSDSGGSGPGDGGSSSGGQESPKPKQPDCGPAGSILAPTGQTAPAPLCTAAPPG